MWHAILRMLGATALLLLAAGPARAQAEQPYDEEKVKAAFLLRFADFVQWPPTAFPDAATPLRIGIAGDESLESELSLLAKLRTAPQRGVSSQNVHPGQALRTLHVLFVSRNERANLSRYVGAVSGAPVLVVTDFEGALDEGSMINFLTVQRRLRFDIAPGSAESSGLRISSHLLSVARLVRKGDLTR